MQILHKEKQEKIKDTLIATIITILYKLMHKRGINKVVNDAH
jgi:hypothetical protein